MLHGYLRVLFPPTTTQYNGVFSNALRVQTLGAQTRREVKHAALTDENTDVSTERSPRTIEQNQIKGLILLDNESVALAVPQLARANVGNRSFERHSTA